jgi:hypothetical protein
LNLQQRVSAGGIEKEDKSGHSWGRGDPGSGWQGSRRAARPVSFPEREPKGGNRKGRVSFAEETRGPFADQVQLSPFPLSEQVGRVGARMEGRDIAPSWKLLSSRASAAGQSRVPWRPAFWTRSRFLDREPRPLFPRLSAKSGSVPGLGRRWGSGSAKPQAECH